LGRQHGRRTPEVAAAIEAGDAQALAGALRHRGTATVQVGDDTVTIGADDVVVSESPRTGWGVAGSGTETVALDLELTDDLRAAGTVRELVRVVQQARKNLGLDVTDRVELWWQADGDIGAAIEAAAGEIGDEVLAVSVTRGAPTAPLSSHQLDELGVYFWLRPVG
jgi:isoleucyl-tRNA synthetase